MKVQFTIKEYREFLKISQAEMTGKLGVSQAAYSKIESNINYTNNERYEIIAQILDLDTIQVKNNRVEVLFIVCREHINCADIEKLNSTKLLETIEKNIALLNKIYKNY